MFGKAPPSLRTFVEKRTESMVAQLEGKSKGYVPAGMGFGQPGGKGPFPPGGFGPGMFLNKPLMEAADTNKDGKLSREEFMEAAKRFFKECDKDKQGTLDEKALSDGINRLVPPPPNFGGGPAPKDGAGKGVAQAIFKRAGTDKDGKLTHANFMKAAEAFFHECDQDKNGSLDGKEIAAGINQLFPRPPMFGPPGGFPGGPFQPPPPKGQPKKEENP
jgi:Ca2+-binding EF-hand superfamily protein